MSLKRDEDLKTERAPAPPSDAPAAWNHALTAINVLLIKYLIIPALAAGSLLWFTRSWSDTAFMVLIMVGDLFAWMIPQPAGAASSPGLEDSIRSLLRSVIVLVAVCERIAGPGAFRSPAWSVGGLALCLLGILLQRLVARAFSQARTPMYITSRPTTLVQTGIFRFVRHPGYTGLFLVTLGAVLLLRSVWGVVLTVTIYAAAIAVRIRREEALLTATFGDEYRAYAARTRRFIPYLL